MYLLAGKDSTYVKLAKFFRLALMEFKTPLRIAYIGTASDNDEPFFRTLEKRQSDRFRLNKKFFDDRKLKL